MRATAPAADRRARWTSPTTVDLVAVWPELATTIPAQDVPRARRALRSRTITAVDEDLFEVHRETTDDALSLLVLDGVVLKATTLADRSALEFLGPGDLLAPPLSAIAQIESRAVSRFLAHGSVSVAPLDERFRLVARRWPGVSDCLHERLGRQTHRASMHLAMLHLPRVEDRIVALFADLAERFGRMTGEGIVIKLALTHQTIGGLVGSQRPTVSLALQGLAAEEVLTRLDIDRWAFDPGAAIH